MVAVTRSRTAGSRLEGPKAQTPVIRIGPGTTSRSVTPIRPLRGLLDPQPYVNDLRQWGLAGCLMSRFGAFAGLMAVPLFLVTMAIAFLTDSVGTLERSTWEWASLLVRFYALALVLHVVRTPCPLHIAHGGTRRQFFGQLTMFVVAHGAVLAVLTTPASWLESMVSNVASWSTPTSSYAYFD